MRSIEAAQAPGFCKRSAAGSGIPPGRGMSQSDKGLEELRWASAQCMRPKAKDLPSRGDSEAVRPTEGGRRSRAGESFPPSPLGAAAKRRGSKALAPQMKMTAPQDSHFHLGCDIGLEPMTPRTTIWCSTN